MSGRSFVVGAPFCAPDRRRFGVIVRDTHRARELGIIDVRVALDQPAYFVLA
jgi:hypothetical protein